MDGPALATATRKSMGWKMTERTARARRAIEALRAPDHSLARVPNTIRQSIAEVIEDQANQIDSYGLALMMIREGCADPTGVARIVLDKFH